MRFCPPENPSVASDQDGKWNEELKQEEAQPNVKPDIGEIVSEKPRCILKLSLKVSALEL